MSFGYVAPTNGFTLEFWMKRDALPAAEVCIINQRTQSAVNWSMTSTAVGYGRQFYLGMGTSGNLILRFTNEGATTGTDVVIFNDPTPGSYGNDNTWHHFVIRLLDNKLNWAIFIDGVVYASGVASAAINWSPGILTFGATYAPLMTDGGAYVFDKWLAYLAAYDYDIPTERILEHYIAGSGGTVYYGDDEVRRMTRIADWAEVPDQSREFEDALVELQGFQAAGTNALSAFQDTVAAASGLMFADGQSRLVYHNRQHRYNRWNVVTLGESSDSAPEVGITFTIDDSNIYNDVRGERPNGATVRLVDEISKAAHGRKVYSFSIPVTTGEELTNAVAWITSQYRDAVVRVSDISLRAESSALIEWVGTGGITVGDHITLDELPPDAAPEVSMEFTVEKIGLDVDIKNREYIVRLELTPYTFSKVFQVGVSNLGSEWKVAY